MSLLFTYGTLQRHQRNHWRLYNSKYIGRGVVNGELFQFRLNNFPLLRRHPTKIVYGEIYRVSPAVLDLQDWHELWYKRVKVLAYGEGPALGRWSCWVYEALDILPLTLARKLPTGRWTE